MSGRRLLYLFVPVLCVLLAACATSVKGGPPEKALPAVSPLPAPTVPAWIVQISPKGQAQTLAQIRIIFKDPLIPLQAIEDPSQQAKLAQFTIDPPLPGRFRFLTPRMVGFQQDRALPIAARIRVTLNSGLSDLAGHTLTTPLSWTFNTTPVQITDLPQLADEYGTSIVVGLMPSIGFTSNVELDSSSLTQHVSLVNTRTDTAVAVSISPDTSGWPTPEATPEQAFDVSQQSWRYVVKPQQPLNKSTTYDVVISRGLMPAIGNVPSDKEFRGHIQTYGALTFTGLQRDSSIDRFLNGPFLLAFSNPLVADSVQKNLSISPVPISTTGLWQASVGDTSVTVNSAWLAPQKTYTITIGPGITDKFGQTLGSTHKLTFNTGDLTANFWMPDSINIFPASDNLQLNVSAVNLVDGKYFAYYKVLQPSDVITYESPYSDTVPSLFPDPSQWPVFAVKAKRNQVVTIPVPLRQKLSGATGMLAYGASARTQQSPAVVKFFGFVQLTNLGVFAQWFPTQGLVRVAHLSDGSAASDARVDIYNPRAIPCASGTTNANGSFLVSADVMRSCIATSVGDYGGPLLVAVAHEGADWAYARTEPWSGAYGYGLDTSWDRGDPQSRGTIYSDRSLYQPSEKADFTAAAYYVQNGALHQDRLASYEVKLTAPDGSSTIIGHHTTDNYGMFSFELPLRANQPLGYYSLSAKGPNGVVITGDFRVAEFKPPNFKVELTLDKDFAYPGDSVFAQAASSYLFGSPVSAGQASYYVTRRQTYFTPKGWDDYTFGRQWYWPEQPPSISSDVLQTKQPLSDTGKFQQQIKVDASIPYPLTYQVDAQVVDVSNLSVADSKSFTVLPNDQLIGLQSPWIGTAGKPMTVQFLVSDPKGQLQSGRGVNFDVQQATYGTAAQLVEGGESNVNAVTYKTVASAQAKSSGSPQNVLLTAPSAGVYRIRANFSDSKDESTATDTLVWVTGPGAVNWGAPDRNVLQVKLDKQSYRIGEVATALVQSPYPQAQLYFAVIRNKILYSRVQNTNGSAPEIRFRITPDMMPNAAVEAVLVRRGKPLQTLSPGSIDSLARTGFAPFSINLDGKYLKVAVSAAHATLEPDSHQTVSLTVRDASGHPRRAEVAVMVVNETILQLTGYRPPDLVQTVYAQQMISTTFADNRPNVTLEQIPSPLEKGYGYGGGFLAAAASTRVRTNFQPLAYYNGALQTDASGQATFSFKLPDDLTTWRVMSVAVASGSGGPTDFRFGNADTTFVTSKPLVTNPVLPQFARPGDSMEAGLSITNISAGSGTLDITGSLQGPLVFKPANGAQSNAASLSTNAPATTAAYRFTMFGTAPGTANVEFRSSIGGATDAFGVPLNLIAPANMMESVAESGVTQQSVTIPVKIDPNVATDVGGLEIDLASTLIPEITVPGMEMLTTDDLPFAEPEASRLFVSADLKVLASRYSRSLGSFNPDASAAAALAQLVKLQRPDGGFAFCPCFEQSDVFVTPYVARSIAAARAAGITVDPALVSTTRSYLEKKLPDPGVCEHFNVCYQHVRLDLLVALAEFGEPRDDFLSDIYAERDNFDPLGQVLLARHLLRFPNWRTQGVAMASKIGEIINITGRNATINYPGGWEWLSSVAATRAQTLRLYVSLNNDPELIDKLLTSLLAMRHNGNWDNSYDTAEALSALIEYGALEAKPPNFTATSRFAGSTLQSVHFSGYSVTTAQHKVPMVNLPRGSHPLVLAKSGQGQLHYLVSYNYRLQGNQPGQIAGLRITRYVREAAKDNVLARMGLNAPNDPLTLAPGQIYDVGLELITDHPIDHVVITDELPAGLEAVDTSFKTSTTFYQALGDTWEIDYQAIYHDRVVAYASQLDAGIYTFHYLVRSVTPGNFLWPPADAHLEFAPEEFGRTSSSTLIISQ